MAGASGDGAVRASRRHQQASSADLSPVHTHTRCCAGGYNWNGLYLGLNAGAAFGTDRQQLQAAASALRPVHNIPGFIGGAQIGVNYQIGAVVWGVEADFDASTQNGSLASGVLSGTSQMPWFGTLRGRLGVAFDRLLVYGDGGRRRRRAEVQFRNTHRPHQHDRHLWHMDGRRRVSNTASPTISARASNTFTSTPATSTPGSIGPPTTTITSRLKDNLVRAGLNYRFPVALVKRQYACCVLTVNRYPRFARQNQPERKPKAAGAIWRGFVARRAGRSGKVGAPIALSGDAGGRASARARPDFLPMSRCR